MQVVDGVGQQADDPRVVSVVGEGLGRGGAVGALCDAVVLAVGVGAFGRLSARALLSRESRPRLSRASRLVVSAGADLEAEGLAGGDVGRAGGEDDEVVQVGVVGEAGLEDVAALAGLGREAEDVEGDAEVAREA